jgi:hypothetical protein
MYIIWVRINAHQTVNMTVWAENDWTAKQMAKSLFGVSGVLNYTHLSD